MARRSALMNTHTVEPGSRTGQAGAGRLVGGEASHDAAGGTAKDDVGEIKHDHAGEETVSSMPHSLSSFRVVTDNSRHALLDFRIMGDTDNSIGSHATIRDHGQRE